MPAIDEQQLADVRLHQYSHADGESVGKLDDQHVKPAKAEGPKAHDATKLASAGAQDEECCEAETKQTANATATGK